MSAKILVADDSLTIQKVISITLANNNYSLSQALTVDELLNAVKETEFDLILLDYNLSDEMKGNDLAKEIHKASPNIRILGMLGTFDSIDDSVLIDAGIGENIVKPFESTKFIKKCQKLLEGEIKQLDDISFTEQDEELPEINSKGISDDNISVDLDDEWVMESPEIEDKSISANISKGRPSLPNANLLLDQMKEWGVSVPATISSGSDSEKGLMPPSISSRFEEKIHMDDMSFGLDESDDDNDQFEINDAPKIKLTPIEELDIPEDDEELFEEKIAEIKLFDIASEIADDQNPDDFWAADEKVEAEQELEEVLIEKDETSLGFDDVEKTEDIQPVIEDFKNQESEDLIDTNKIINEILEKLRPELENMVQKYCAEVIERVAWDIIPDLAENLISKEISKISDSLKP